MVDVAPRVIIPKFRPKEDKGWWDRIDRGIRTGWNKELVLQEQRMKENARLEAMTPRKTVEGLGQLVAIIDLQNYLRWDDAEKGCWNDKKFKAEYIRDNPDCRAAKPEKKYI